MLPQWTVHLEGGPRRVNHAAILVGDMIFSFGGYCTGEDYDTRRPMDVHVLNTVSYKWKALPAGTLANSSVPYQRYGHTAVNMNDEAYIWGGRNDVDGACNILYKYDPCRRKWTRPTVGGQPPGARDGHSACVVNGAMYIFGGYEENVDKFSNEVHRLVFTTMTWERLVIQGRKATWRDFHSATAIGDSMFVFGGRSDRGGPYHTNNEVYDAQIQIFDTNTLKWSEPTTCGTMPLGRRSHSAFVFQEKLYIFGGYNGVEELHFDDLFQFDPETQTWSEIEVRGSKPCARRRQCCLINENRVFIFGGTSPCDGSLSADDLDLVDHSDLHVLDLSPTLKTLCLLSVLRHKLNSSNLPKDLRLELSAMTTNSTITRPFHTSG